MKIISFKRSWYLFQKLPFHKGLEVGFQQMIEGGFDLYCSFSLVGKHHAGLMFSIHLWKLFFELNICDNRHWNYKENRWFLENE